MHWDFLENLVPEENRGLKVLADLVNRASLVYQEFKGPLD